MRVKNVQIQGLSHVNQDIVPPLRTFNTKIGGLVTEKKLKQDARRLYLLGCFSSVRIEKKELQYGVSIIFHVKENPVINTVSLRGNRVFSSLSLISQLNHKPGMVLNHESLAKDIARIESFYYEKGYELFKVKSVQIEGDDLIFILTEGRISTVNWEGLSSIKASILSRESTQKEGTVFNTNSLKKDHKRFLKMPYFSEVSFPELMPSKQGDRVDIIYRVKEKKSNLISAGIEQLENNEGTALFLQLKYNHALIHSDKVVLKTQVLIDEAVGVRTYFIEYEQPWIFNRYPIHLTSRLWTEFIIAPYDGETIGYDIVRKGGLLQFGVPLFDNFLKSSIGIKVESIEPREIGIFDSYFIQSLIGTISFSTLDSSSYPKKGRYMNMSYERGGRIGSWDLGGIDFSRFRFDVAQFMPLSERLVLGTKLGYGDYNRLSHETVKTFENEAFYLGGSNSLRGYKELSFVGDKKVVMNIETRYDLGKDIQGVLFYDIGLVSDTSLTLDLSRYKTGRGIGIRYLTGLAPFRLDFAWGDTEFMIHFNIGQVF